MQQLPLKIIQRLSYLPQNFLPHAGVREIFAELSSWKPDANYQIRYIQGTARAGKTHLAVTLFSYFTDSGFIPYIVDGSEFSKWLERRNLENGGNGLLWSAAEVLIVDDIDHYLKHLKPGQSGEFVGVIERIRNAGAKLIFLGELVVDDLPCDDHIKSRLRAASGLIIGAPGESELPSVLVEIARQRGIKLPERIISFLVRRLRRDIPALERYLERLLHLSSVLGAPIKGPIVQDAL